MSEPLPMTAPLYDRIGAGYARYRRADPRVGAQIADALGDAASVVNVGAGTGSYEPTDRAAVIAVEPSAAMVAQRPAGAPPCVRATALALPFRARAFDAALAVLTVHHWPDWRAGAVELRRVARRRAVVLTWDPDAGAFWLVRDYLPTLLERDRAIFPPIDAFARALGDDVEVRPVPIPWDCRDGFLGAYWRRPRAYLDAARRGAISSLATPTPPVWAGLARLGRELADGSWAEGNAALLRLDALDMGYRLVVAHF